MRAFILMIGLVIARQSVCAQVAPTAPAAASAAQATDTGSVVRALVDAMKHNDGARI